MSFNLLQPRCIAVLILLISLAGAVSAADKYILQHSVITSATPEQIWRLWTDVNNWKQFDERLEYSQLIDNAQFSEGASGVIKSAGAPRTRFKLLNVIPNQSFTERLYVPLWQSIDLKRRVEINAKGQTVFTHEVHFNGPLRFFVHLASAKAFKKDLPLVMTKMKELAELQQ